MIRMWIALTSGLMSMAGTPALAQVGIVRTVEGQVNVMSGKQECAPRYGLDLEAGDVVRTGAKSWALLAMIDGTKITVRPDSEMRIAAFRYTDLDEFAQNHALLSLLTGAVRVTPGRVAVTRGKGFQVQTPDANMTLRGADHDVAFVPPDGAEKGDAPTGTYGRSHVGYAILKNAHGEVTIRTGQTAYAAPKVNAPPRVLETEPYFYHWHNYIDRRAAAIADKLETLAP
jgi:hypothetical protein